MDRDRRLPPPAVAGFVVASTVWVGAILAGVGDLPVDAANFYNHLDDPYAVHDYASGQGFYYSPPVALAMKFLALAGPRVFSAVLVAIGLAALLWIGGRWAWALLFFPPVWWDLTSGNVNVLIGAATIAMLARPGWIGVPLLTKVTPGVTGLWWLVRGEWRAAATAAGIVGAIVAVTLVLVPDYWIGWLTGLLSNGAGYTGPGYFTIPIPLLPRLALAAAVVVWAARTDRPRFLAIAATLAMPVLWFTAIAAAVAVVRTPPARPERQSATPPLVLQPEVVQ